MKQDTGYVDIHSHILPGVDDGAETWEEAVDILKVAANAGTTVMVATPHGDNRARWDNIDSLKDLSGDLNAMLASEGVPLNIVLGMENPLELDMVAQVKRGTALTLNGSEYILVELPFQQLPIYWEEVLFQLQLDGLHPIIAHPERQVQLQANPNLLSGLVERGILLQVTAGSLVGSFGPRAKKAAETLFKKGFAHIIASDCHRSEGSRGPDLNGGARAATKIVGQSLAIQMVSDLPRAIVQGDGTANVT